MGDEFTPPQVEKLKELARKHRGLTNLAESQAALSKIPKAMQSQKEECETLARSIESLRADLEARLKEVAEAQSPPATDLREELLRVVADQGNHFHGDLNDLASRVNDKLNELHRGLDVLGERITRHGKDSSRTTKYLDDRVSDLGKKLEKLRKQLVARGSASTGPPPDSVSTGVEAILRTVVDRTELERLALALNHELTDAVAKGMTKKALRAAITAHTAN